MVTLYKKLLQILNLRYLPSSKQLGDKIYLFNFFFLLRESVPSPRSGNGMRSREVNNAIPFYRNIIGALYLRVAANPVGNGRSEFKWAKVEKAD